MTESTHTAAPIIVVGLWGLIMLGLLVWFLWPARMEHNSSIRRSNRSTQPDIHSCPPDGAAGSHRRSRHFTPGHAAQPSGSRDVRPGRSRPEPRRSR